MKMLTWTLICLFVVGVMIFSNPTLDDFKMFLDNKLHQQVEQEELDSGAAALATVFGGMATGFLAGQTIRHDYLIMSTYELQLSGAKYRAIGGLSNFYVVESPWEE